MSLPLVTWVGMQFVILAFLCHTYLPYFISNVYKIKGVVRGAFFNFIELYCISINIESMVPKYAFSKSSSFCLSIDIIYIITI